MKKHASAPTVFYIRTEFKRYFVLDHNAYKLRIYKSNDMKSKSKVYNYS